MRINSNSLMKKTLSWKMFKLKLRMLHKKLKVKEVRNLVHRAQRRSQRARVPREHQRSQLVLKRARRRNPSHPRLLPLNKHLSQRNLKRLAAKRLSKINQTKKMKKLNYHLVLNKRLTGHPRTY